MRREEPPLDLSFLPAVNATLNGLAAALLILGFVLIRQRKINAHRACMISAFVISALFLALYVLHKGWRASTGAGWHTSYNRHGLAKVIYLVILFTHLALAMLVPFLAILLIRLGIKRRYALHRRIARFALPVWLYVSITGVLIYVLLYYLNPQPTDTGFPGGIP